MNDTPSNESKNLPNVPEDTQGQIHKIVNNNPQIEKLRRVRHKEVMQGNTFHLKSGKYSKQLPQYLIDYLSYIDELSFDRQEVSGDVVIRLLKANLKRIALAEYREQMNSNTINQQLSKLIRDTYIMAMGINQTPSLLRVENNAEINLNGFSNDQLEAVDKLVVALRELAFEPDYPNPVLPS